MRHNLVTMVPVPVLEVCHLFRMSVSLDFMHDNDDIGP